MIDLRNFIELDTQNDRKNRTNKKERLFGTKMIGCVTSNSLFSRKKDLTLQKVSLNQRTYLYIIT